MYYFASDLQNLIDYILECESIIHSNNMIYNMEYLFESINTTSHWIFIISKLDNILTMFINNNDYYKINFRLSKLSGYRNSGYEIVHSYDT